ncbi:hypothetical protein FHR81_004952 [Actinoalloteichus hoggarensis]|nr:hypothetical protein [Actinoalloteichus hoggarensis]MBB5923879.1 hypothetical protein [Actinoalloteichus hoggarensis]
MEEFSQHFVEEFIKIASPFPGLVIAMAFYLIYVNKSVELYIRAKYPEMSDDRREPKKRNPLRVAVLCHLLFPATAVIAWLIFFLTGSNVDPPLALLIAPPLLLGVPFLISVRSFKKDRLEENCDLNAHFGTSYSVRWNFLLMRHHSWELLHLFSLLAIGIPLGTYLDSLPNGSGHPSGENQIFTIGATSCAIAAWIAASLVTHKVVAAMTPHASIIDYYMRLRRTMPLSSTSPISESNYKASRWRTGCHQYSHAMARELRYYAAGTRSRLTPGDFQKIASTYDLLATRLAEAGARNAGKEEESPEFRLLAHSAFDLITNRDIMHAAELAKINLGATDHELEKHSKIHSRRERFSNRISDLSQRSSGPLKLTIILGAAIYLIANGDIERVIDYILP